MKPSFDSIIKNLKGSVYLNKDNKDKEKKNNDDDDEEDEEFRKKTIKEELLNFWKDPKKKGGLLLSIVLLGAFLFTSSKMRDIYGLDFKLYKRVTLSVFI